MGKKRSIIVVPSSSPSASSEEEDARALRRRSRPAAAASAFKKPRRRKSSAAGEAALSKRRSRKDVKDEFDMLSEDFSECLYDLSVPGPSCHAKELWVEKYKPRSLSDLAVHKKKVEEVKKWLEERVKTPKEGLSDYTLLLTGQSGTGKSAVIQCVASEIGAELCEWTTPTPTLWSEHLHNSNSGLRYTSKLDEFETFIETIRKYSLLPPMLTSESKKPVIILIDDIPTTNGRVGFGRLKKCLESLTHCTKVPIVILITQCHKNESGDGSSWYWEELEALIERAGARKISFNPITVNSLKKVLLKITKEEKSEVSTESIEEIAKSSSGDIRNAITSLQYYSLNPKNFITAPQPMRHLTFSYRTYGRDETLSLFHALGKFLHNKREDVIDVINPNSQNQPLFTLKERYERKPLKMGTPELILSQAYGNARSVTDFLHENVLDFIDFDHVSDSWVVGSYLSDADCLMGIKSRRDYYEINEYEGLAHIIAASVSARGVLFGNSQPAGSRWHSIRSPRIWQIEQSMRHTKDELLLERYENLETFGSLNLSDMATDFRPAMKQLGSHYLKGSCDASLFSVGNLESEKNADSGEGTEDEIEDW